MGKKGKVGKNRQDRFYHLAKEQGFRSRAAFKLVQLNKRHDFLSGAARGVLDLCAAPGGWMQVARKHMPLSAPCIGIDLVPIRPVSGCSAIVGDITADSTRSDLLRVLRDATHQDFVDVVLNDGSPNMGKAWLQDAYTQSELTLAALKMATHFLAPGGSFISKVFRSNDYNSLLFVMHQLFNRVEATKPSASRAESAEIYVMCLGYKAPKTIDHRLLNPKYVFNDVTNMETSDHQEEKPDLFLSTVMKDMKKRKRHRDGYEDGAFSLFKKVSVLEFCRTSRPVAILVDISQLSFQPQLMAQLGVSEDDAKRIAKLLENLEETTSELLSCCDDVKVLARREFKLLLKWRIAARRTLQKALLLHPQDGDASDANDAPADDQQEGKEHVEGEKSSSADEEAREDEEDDELDAEFQKAKAEVQAIEKRKKRKDRKAQSAIQRKIDMKILMPDMNGEESRDAPEALFSLSTAKKVEGKGVEINDVPVDSNDVMQDDGYDADEEAKNLSTVLKRRRNTLQEVGESKQEQAGEVEKDLDRWYKNYLQFKKKDKNGVSLKESKERKRLTKRQAIREARDKMEKEAEDGEGAQEEPAKLTIDSSDASSAEEKDMADEDMPGFSRRENPESKEAMLWFSQPVFEGMADMTSSDESDASDAMDDGTEEGGQDKKVEENFQDAAMKEAKRIAEKESQKKEKKEGDNDFEVVAQEKDKGNESSASSFHSSDYDTDEKAEMVAIGRRMRESKRESNDVLDEGYHRYTFDDPMDLPRWFADQDGVYRERQAPVNKEQVEEMKEYIKSLETLPTKREAEAKARRRARMSKRIESMKNKANSIAEQSDVSVKSRMKAIEDVYKQAMKGSKGKKKKVYQVVRPDGRMTVGKNAGKGRKAMKGGKTVVVDRRLKADKRGIAKAQRKAKRRT